MSRTHIWLPLFMYLSVRYLDQLESRDPDLFAHSFGQASRNRSKLLTLLERVERAVERWHGALERTGIRPFHSERRFWAMYQALKADVFQ